MSLKHKVLRLVLPDSYGLAGRIVERIRGTRILEIYKYFTQTQWFSRHELDDMRNKKLRRLMARIESNHPWYKEFWSTTGKQPVDIQTVEDLESLPVLTKDNFRYGKDRGLIGTDIDSLRVDKTMSGGTTGDPVQLLLDRRGRSNAGASIMRYYGWHGRKIGERMGVLWGRQEDPAKTRRRLWMDRQKNLISQMLVLNTFYVDDDIWADYYSQLQQFDPLILKGYSNSVYLFGEYVRRNGLPLWPSLKMIACTSDKLTDAMRASMKSIFQVPVTSYYGCGEVMGVSGDCEKISQHISEEHIILETVDDDGRPVVDKPGRILLTDLDNYAMPLVRYEVGDIGIITHEPCTCGRVHTILQEITGRLSETLDLANSRRIAPSYWSVLFRPIEQIKRGCVRIVKPDHLEIDLVLSAPIPEENYVYLKESVAEAVGAGIRVDWREVDTIPRVRSGKYPWVRKAEDEIPDEEAG